VPVKTVRFAQVVQRSGRPHAHSLWVTPDKDPELVRARKADRVMTVESSARGKADVGIIGFDVPHQKGSQLLIFPRSLKPFAGARIVGIKFDQIEQPGPLEGARRESPKPRARKSRPSTPHHRQMNATAEEDAPSVSVSHARSGARRPPPVRRSSSSRAAQSPKHAMKSASAANVLTREILAALEEMRRGESVAAYERLRRAIGK
jgi:hypothetical protein